MSVRRRRLRLLLIYLACAVLLFWALAPIYWVVVSSISTRTCSGLVNSAALAL